MFCSFDPALMNDKSIQFVYLLWRYEKQDTIFVDVYDNVELASRAMETRKAEDKLYNIGDLPNYDIEMRIVKTDKKEANKK